MKPVSEWEGSRKHTMDAIAKSLMVAQRRKRGHGRWSDICYRSCSYSSCGDPLKGPSTQPFRKMPLLSYTFAKSKDGPQYQHDITTRGTFGLPCCTVWETKWIGALTHWAEAPHLIAFVRSLRFKDMTYRIRTLWRVNLSNEVLVKRSSCEVLIAEPPCQPPRHHQWCWVTQAIIHCR